MSRQLSDDLLGPVRERIARAERLLAVADGPLHMVPFAALPAPGAPAESRYLVEAKPVQMAASATVFAELKKGRGRFAHPGRWAAFTLIGDWQ